MADQTIRDALIAELLGDVGKLYDAIKAMPQELQRVQEKSLSEMRRVPRSAINQRTALALPALVVAGIATTSFCAGAFFGTKNISLLLPGSIGLAMGLGFGAVLSYLFLLRLDKQVENTPAQLEILDKLEAISRRFGDTRLWSEEEFHKAARDLTLSYKTLEACRAVLVAGMDQDEAAEKEGVMSVQLTRALFQIRKNRKQ